ncbi:PREDICTED: uncharacterized protein LOC108363609 [Rhagoletis zephyria]|uniref:uncharacterized protein LOC108363609 n=1 Tax=Rhagoletis zephyria TaxID=28612 RepID=UPI0008116C5D|nr:PREDICTED: uncharacterized protein LOC108363609 [Rhagoletis zephyria]
MFHKSTKGSDESISMWYARVKKLALNCKFGEHLNAFVLDQFIMGLPEGIFERLCEEDAHLTLETALRKALIMESKQTSKVNHAEESNVNYIKRSASNKHIRSSGGDGGTSAERPKGSNDRNKKGTCNNKKTSHVDRGYRKACSHCGWRNLDSYQCKFKNSKCHACGKAGYLASVCYSKSNKAINYLSDSDESSQVDSNDNLNFSVYGVSGRSPYDVHSLPLMVRNWKLLVTPVLGVV